MKFPQIPKMYGIFVASVRKNTTALWKILGKFANKGRVRQEIINNFFENKFFFLPPPKSLDRNELKIFLKDPRLESLSVEDSLATLTTFTAETIIKGIKLLKKKPVTTVIMGGGQHNKYLVSKLKKKLPGRVYTANEIDLPGDFIEAELIAYLAARRINNLPITFPETTGVKSPKIGGDLYSIR